MMFLRVSFLLSIASIAYSQCVPTLTLFNPANGSDFFRAEFFGTVTIESLTTPFDARAEFCGGVQSVLFAIISENDFDFDFDALPRNRNDNSEPYTSGPIGAIEISSIRESSISGESPSLVAVGYDGFKATGNVVDYIVIGFDTTRKTIPFSVSLVSPSTSNFTGPAPLVFELSGTIFGQPLDRETSLSVNLQEFSFSDLNSTRTRLTVNRGVAIEYSTRNFIDLRTTADNGEPISFITLLWIGFESLTVNVVDSEGNPFLIPTTLTATLANDFNVQAIVNTDTGSATFENVPDRTILIEAISENGDLAIVATAGSSGTISIDITAFSEPSAIDNNDFSRGLAGWVVANRRTTETVPHIENVGPGEPSFDFSTETPDSDFPFASPDFDEIEISRQVQNRDLVLTAEGLDIQEVSRTFVASFGTTGIRVRYRFVSGEVPFGNFGSEFNDFFFVSIRSQIARGSTAELTGMNALGLGAFDTFSGSTAWRELILRLDEDFDTVNVGISVANVEDGEFSGRMVVDFVEELGCNLGEPIEAPSLSRNILRRAETLANESNILAEGSGLPGARNGPRDAFRQCAWSCQMNQELGAREARIIGDFHEDCGGNPEAERLMDLRNNEVGRGLGTPGANCGTLCFEAASNGELQTSL